MKVAPAQFGFLRDLLRRRTGVVIDDSKQYLVVARMLPIVRQRRIPSIETLLDRVRQGVDPTLERDVLSAMMTHETSFFRDAKPFDALRRVITEMLPRRAMERQLVLWSAGCSSGQEPFSMAMTILEHFPRLVDSWKIRILATDYSDAVLARARAGDFSELETGRGLAPELRRKYFQPLQGRWSVSQACRRLVEFRRLNLVEPWPPLPRCDVIFLRNVMIYFEPATRREVIGRMGRILRPDGSLFLGGAETLIGVDDGWLRQDDGGSSRYRREAR